MASPSVLSNYLIQFLNGKPTLAELCEQINIGTKWYKFGVLLKLNTTELDVIEHQYKESDVKVVKMFELWLSSKPKATRKEVIDTLRKDAIGENALAEQYQRVLKESELLKYVCFNMVIYSFSSLTKIVQKEFPRQLLQKHSESLLQYVFPMETLWMLHKEGVISKETLEELERSGGSLTDDSLRALFNTVSDDPNQLKVFSTVLLHSEDTIHFAKDILKEYSKWFVFYGNCVIILITYDNFPQASFEPNQLGMYNNITNICIDFVMV